jgi:excisionase family DNA binding protein
MRNEDTRPNTTRKEIFSTGEAAELCKVSQQTIIRCFDSGRLQGFRVPGSRFRRIPRAELLRFMRANAIPTDVLENIVRRVLIVDNDTAFIEYVQEIAGADARFDLRAAETGFEAGLLLARHRPHLVLLDHMLPDLDSALFCRRLREADDLPDSRILILSSVAGAREIDLLEEHGADGFMRKPFDVGRLIPLVEQLLGV